MEDKKSIFKQIKEFWSNRRYRSFVIFGFYIIFFIIVGLLINSPSKPTTNNTPKIDSLLNYKDMVNYEYTYNIIMRKNLLTNNITITGKKYGYKEQFKISDKNYYMEKGVIYDMNDNLKVVNDILEIDFSKLKPSDIYSLVSQGNLDSTTNYSDSSIKKTYQVNLKLFSKNYSNNAISSENYILISTYEKDKIITRIDLDLKEYFNYSKQLYEIYMIEINYQNIGKVEDFNMNIGENNASN